MNEGMITCPKCGAEIPLTEAVSHQVRDQLEAQFQKQRKEHNEAITAREKKLQAETDALLQRQKDLSAVVALQVDAGREKLLVEAARMAEEKLNTQLKDLQSQLLEQQLKANTAQAAELELRKKQRELEEAKAGLELEVARKIDEERGKIADTARQQGAETERLKVAEKEQVIKGLQDQIAALQQRAAQGSTQLQGETLEVELENDLRRVFLHDEILEIKKGQRGADVMQRVRTSGDLICGAILWEAKRAKNWTRDWIEKLKEDQREAKAELAVIVTTCLPEGVRGIGQVEGVWVCEPPFAIALASALRHGLISTAVQRLQDTDRSDKMVRLYDYLCGVEFRQHVEALVDTFKGLQEQLDAEQRAFAKQWKERAEQIQKAILHTAQLYGGIQGIAGRDSLPEIKNLQLPGLTP